MGESANSWGKVPTVSGEAEGRPGEARRAGGGAGGAGCLGGGPCGHNQGAARVRPGAASAGGELSEAKRQVLALSCRSNLPGVGGHAVDRVTLEGCTGFSRSRPGALEGPWQPETPRGSC